MGLCSAAPLGRLRAMCLGRFGSIQRYLSPPIDDTRGRAKGGGEDHTMAVLHISWQKRQSAWCAVYYREFCKVSLFPQFGLIVRLFCFVVAPLESYGQAGQT